jgi:hypothetical protein
MNRDCVPGILLALDPQQTRALAKRILSGGGDNRQRIERAYVLLQGRPPGAEELQIGLEFLGRGEAVERHWEEYCQVLLCANEFLHVD